MMPGVQARRAALEVKPFRRPRPLLRPRALARLYQGRRYDDDEAAVIEAGRRWRARPLAHSVSSCALGWLDS